MTTFCWLPPDSSPTDCANRSGHDPQVPHPGLCPVLHLALAEEEAEASQDAGGHLGHVGEESWLSMSPSWRRSAGTIATPDRTAAGMVLGAGWPSGRVMLPCCSAASPEDALEDRADPRALQSSQAQDLPGDDARG